MEMLSALSESKSAGAHAVAQPAGRVRARGPGSSVTIAAPVLRSGGPMQEVERGRSRKHRKHSSSRSRSRSRSAERKEKRRRHKHKHKRRTRSRTRSRSAERVDAARRFLGLAAQEAPHSLPPQPPSVLAADDSVAAARELDKAGRKAARKEAAARLEELVPREGGREGRLAEKTGRREIAKQRDASPDVAHVTGGGDVFGGSDSFAAALARQKRADAARAQRRDAKTGDMDSRVAAFAAAEDAKMAAFRALLAGGAPLAIPKRE